MLRQEEIRSIISDPANKMKVSEVEKNLLSCQEENIQIQRDNAGKQKELLRMAMKVRDLANKNLQISELEKRNTLLEQEVTGSRNCLSETCLHPYYCKATSLINILNNLDQFNHYVISIDGCVEG